MAPCQSVTARVSDAALQRELAPVDVNHDLDVSRAVYDQHVVARTTLEHDGIGGFYERFGTHAVTLV
jgi:hypothetical protein